MICPECKKEVSTEVTACPHCGYPLVRVAKETPPSISLPQLQSRTQTAPAATSPVRGKSIGCGGYLAIVIFVIIVLAIIGAFIPEDPNYKAGYEAGKSIGQTERPLYDYKTPSSAALDREARIVGSTMCPDLHGDAFEKWVEGFKNGY